MGVIIADGRRPCASCKRESASFAWATFPSSRSNPEREALAAEQQRREAEQSRAQAQDLHDRADEVDPDADLDRDEKAGDRRA